MKNLLLKSFILFIGFTLTNCSSDDPLILVKPSNLIASTTFALKINLEWSKVENAASYTIFRSDYFELESDLNFIEIGTSEEDTYTDLDVVSFSSYYYKIEATNGGVSSEKSENSLGKTKIITLDESFDVLAEYTGGVRYNANNANEVPEAIIQIIEDNASVGTDLIFLIDNTGSMGDDIWKVKTSINDIISKLPNGVKLGMATYNDENLTSNWYNKTDLSTNFDSTITFLNNIRAYGGGDVPESVYHGIYLTVNEMSWSSNSKRIIIVIGDAPPLEGIKSKYSLKEVIDKCNELSIATNLFPILIKN